MGKCCVSGAGALNIDYKNRTVEIDGVVLKEGDYISLNGSTGVVYNGKVETQAAELSGDFAELMTLADKYTRLQVRTNADTPHDAEVARNFGAVGIGLCRTEHMFFEGEKIKAMREMILAENAEGRRKALACSILLCTSLFPTILLDNRLWPMRWAFLYRRFSSV